MKKSLHLIMLIVFSFVVSAASSGQYTGTNPNVASLKTAISSDTVEGYGPELAVNELLDDSCSIPGDPPAWIQVDLGSYYTIDGFGLVIPNADEIPGEITFQSSVYGFWWSNLRHFFITEAGTFTYDIGARDSVRYVRFYITDKDIIASIAELYVYGTEMTPPYSAPMSLPATNISYDSFTANWTQRATATGYRLSVYSDQTFTNYVPGFQDLDVGNTLSWQVAGLSPVSTYYYRVKAYNISGETSYGNSTSATTIKAPQTINFEILTEYSYGDVVVPLNGTASSGLEISYTSSDEAVAIIDGQNAVITGIGTTTITAFQEGNAEYEAAPPVATQLVVNRRVLTVTGVVASDKVYDGTATANLSGALLSDIYGTDDVSLADDSYGTFSQSDVGNDLPITTAMTLSGADAGKYSLVQPENITASITPAALTVTAEDKVRESCASNPEFTMYYSGFVGGESANVLTSRPVATSTADETTPPGVYDITLSGGSAVNYEFIYITGTLTVSPDVTDPLLTVQNITVTLDESDYGEIAASDIVTSASDNCGLADTTLSQSTFGLDDVGDVAVDVTLTDINGNTTIETATITVERSTGTEDWQANEYRLYPNPFNDRFIIEVHKPFTYTFEIRSLSGKLILDGTLTGTSSEIDLTTAPKGVYLITIRSRDHVTTGKIVRL